MAKYWLEALAEGDYQGYVNPFMHGEVAPDEMDHFLGESRAHLLSIYEQLFYRS